MYNYGKFKVSPKKKGHQGGRNYLRESNIKISMDNIYYLIFPVLKNRGASKKGYYITIYIHWYEMTLEDKENSLGVEISTVINIRYNSMFRSDEREREGLKPTTGSHVF